LPTITKALGVFGNKDQRKELEAVLAMQPAQMFVLHLSRTSGKRSPKIVSIESVSPTFDD
jgi:hypothetical protein